MVLSCPWMMGKGGAVMDEKTKSAPDGENRGANDVSNNNFSNKKVADQSESVNSQLEKIN